MIAVGRVLQMGHGLLRACHPLPTAAVTALATGLAVAVGNPPGRVALIVAAVLTGQLSIGWSNDAVDADRDRQLARPDKPVAVDEISRRAVAAAAVIALLCTAGLSLALGAHAGLVHLVVVAGGWAYNLGLKRTALSWLPYVVAFGALPAFVVRTVPAAPPWWLIMAGSALGLAAHLANVLPDLAGDAATGVRGFPHRIGPRRSVVLAAAVLALTSIMLAAAPPGPPSPWQLSGAVAGCALATTILVVGWRSPGDQWIFRGVLATAAVDVLLLIVSGATIAR